jgi:hypothetical protein
MSRRLCVVSRFSLVCAAEKDASQQAWSRWTREPSTLRRWKAPPSNAVKIVTENPSL